MLRLPRVLPLRVTFQTAEPQRLPAFLGSALHGALGRALYRTVCVFPRRDACRGCPLYARCAYPSLLETPAPPAIEALRSAGIRDQAPRPLVLAPEPGWTRPSGHPFRLDAGHEVPLRITLIGPAVDDLAVVVVALQAVARRGLGIPENASVQAEARQHRAALQLASVTTADGRHVVYDAANDMFAPSVDSVAADETAAEAIEIELVSPLRLKDNGRLAATITPTLFFRTLARRANALSLLYGSKSPAVDEAEVASHAATIVAEHATLRRVHVQRYSTRQQQRMQWPGLTGRLRWRGTALRPLWPLLRFGERVQVGKGTALGFGRYRIVA
jgi:CRISPR-associated endoribonuclease Cas6